jgi:hypothetical protein
MIEMTIETEEQGTAHTADRRRDRTSLQLAWLDEQLAALAQRCRAVTVAVNAAEREDALWAVVEKSRELMEWRDRIESQLMADMSTDELPF